MKRLALGLCLNAVIATGPAHAQDKVALDEVRRLATAGAVDLALDRIERDQPRQPNSPAWPDWEALRIELLASRGRDAEVLERMRAFPDPPTAGTASGVILATAAQSALRSGDAVQARGFLARLFLNGNVSGGDYRSARLGVIEAFLTEGDADAAYRTMLRFQQDFSPLRAEEAERFVAGLIQAERVNEAANWLTRVNPNSPWSAILRMRAGLLSPDAAVAQARAAIAKGGDSSSWALLAAAGRAQGNRSIAIEVSEHRLNIVLSTGKKADYTETTAVLWRLYAEAAQEAANQAKLLWGDDPAWLSQAARMHKKQPHLARALLGFVALNGRAPQARAEAQRNMIAALRDSKLMTTALRLYADQKRFPIEQLDERVRFELGSAAMESGQPQLAVRYWHSLAAPSDVNTPQWQAIHCFALMQAGRSEEALVVARNLVAAKPPPAPEVLRRLIDVARYAQAHSQLQPAKTMLGLLLTVVSNTDRSAVLGALGRVHEADGDHRAAASAYLQAAMAASAPEAEFEALRSREAAAESLLRAGLRQDARTVYEWLARNAKNAAIKDAAARQLEVLQ